MASLKDVAKRANVSTATVSYVINNTRNVSPEYKFRVEKAIQELGYDMNLTARGLKMGKSQTIGVILPELASIFFPDILYGIEEEARSLDYNILFISSKQDIASERKYINILKSKSVDGIILDSFCSVEKESEYAAYLSGLKKANNPLPVVSLERAFQNKVNSVLIDRKYYSYVLAKYLLGLGHRSILVISGPSYLSMTVESLDGFLLAYSELNLEFDKSRIFYCDYTAKDGYSIASDALSRDKSITAVFAFNDQTAIGAIKAIKRQGLKIPQDIAVVGFDDIFPATLIEPSVTTVHVPRYDLGRQAMKLLSKHIINPELAPESVKLNCELKIRKSTDINADNEWDLEQW